MLCLQAIAEAHVARWGAAGHVAIEASVSVHMPMMTLAAAVCVRTWYAMLLAHMQQLHRTVVARARPNLNTYDHF